jgi:hypothetical protein
MKQHQNVMEAARHICQEARVVLTSLRGGPPNVARGELAQDLIDLRGIVKHAVSNRSPVTGVIKTEQYATSIPTVNGTGTTPPTASASSAAFSEEIDDGVVLVNTTTIDKPATVPPTGVDVGPFARPFLAVVMDPRAAGPHTLVALRALYRLLERSSLECLGISHGFTVALEPLTKGVLNCKFEQTDAGADEAVEMAIADLLALLVTMDRRSLNTLTLVDAFNTVFVTRNTFVHSPALCYHFEDVLTSMIKAVFNDLDHLRDPTAKLILEFLVNQLLHTPLVGGDDEAARDAQIAHDATRVLCLRLARCALRTGFQDVADDLLQAAAQPSLEDKSLLQIVQDDLCLSLLMTGQAIWAYQENSNVSPGFISLEVLSEICSTLSTLWTTVSLRKYLVPQFEAIFTGFYQRALVLLRKRVNPNDSIEFHANIVFDAGIEIILESLVDILCLHDHRHTVAQGNGGALETLFATYDCNVKRADVAVGLMVELCRCTGSKVDEEGDILHTPTTSEAPTPNNTGTTTGETTPAALPPPDVIEEAPSREESTMDPLAPVDIWRQVPPHLKELCAESIMGGMKCLFRDDHPSEQTRQERSERETILAGHVDAAPQSLSNLTEALHTSHLLRSIKSKKRLMRKAARLFNKKSSKGIEFLVSSGIVAEPISPRSVASFLRNGIVVGLNKKEVGVYLGEVGKSPKAGKSPPNWERDWFHKEVLTTYCSLFKFERQSLLDGLRMFLASFRLPGEAQQIDRILQAFSDSCGQCCAEGAAGGSKIFSDDPKRASDAAYLLSFSIIMLNTDQHNDNIREDRKMSKKDFIKNNSDYGRDITEPGKELPPLFLGTIYDSIREEEIRTEGEGADGSMTVERWKDVLRGSSEDDSADTTPTVHDAEDLTELVLEHVYMPIMSAVSALWGVSRHDGKSPLSPPPPLEPGVGGGMLGAQGARLGMDMALDMLVGVRQLGRVDIFRKIFNRVCNYTGLLDYSSNCADRTWSFANSVESQSAVVVILRIAREASDEIGIDGWKRVWSIIFELRDLKMLGGGIATRGRSILMESDPDLLSKDARRDWTMKMIKGAMGMDETPKKATGVSSMFGSFGRALFGSVEEPDMNEVTGRQRLADVVRSVHGKEDHKIWDEVGPSDDEDESNRNDDGDAGLSIHSNGRLSVGAQFENQLIHEDLRLSQQREMPVTGLERVDDSQSTHISPRARVRKRLVQACDFDSLVSESRFMDEEGIGNLLQALIALIPANSPVVEGANGVEVVVDDARSSANEFPLSPGSEGFAEVLICEIALRNRDRLQTLWHSFLSGHYVSRLERISNTFTETERQQLAMVNGGWEKNIAGLLRISCFAVQRGELGNDILSTWKLLESERLESEQEDETKKLLLGAFDRHIGEGLWRLTRFIDGSSQLNAQGWEGLLSLLQWCAYRGGQLPPVRSTGIGRPVGLEEEDPAFQAYRSLHFMLTISEVKDRVPPYVVRSIRSVVTAGELRNCPKLSIGGLDLLHEVDNHVEISAPVSTTDIQGQPEANDCYWKTSWRPLLDCMAEASEMSAYPVSAYYCSHITFSCVIQSRLTLNYLFPSNELRAFDSTRCPCLPIHSSRSAVG